ncbi:MAG: flavodoxin family protein [Bacteroidales bacterium]|nr:flavodoxin family protein [Bacteroidales bacterium]
MKAIFINGSPRKNKNTAQMLESAMNGAQEAGAEVEMIHLQNLNFKGCVSCFACKRKGNTCSGLCIQKDDLRPVLERILQADVLVVGSPIYWSYPTGMFRNLIERLLFPILRYDKGEKPNTASKYIDKQLKCGLIYTMNNTPERYKLVHYDTILEPDRQYMEMMFGHCEVVNAFNTWQFPDYSKFDTSAVDVAEKQRFRDNQWPQDLQKAYELGKRLVEMAKEK